jgi:hypothetical protein
MPGRHEREGPRRHLPLGRRRSGGIPERLAQERRRLSPETGVTGWSRRKSSSGAGLAADEPRYRAPHRCRTRAVGSAN